MTSSQGRGPLAGLTVVTLEHAIAAPLCARQLADLGGRVIKIERPGVGDFARAYDGQPPPERSGAAHATIYPYGPFAAGDGGIVMLGLQNEREWKRFCDEVLRRPELAADPRFDANARRSENRAALKAAIEQAFAGLSARDVIERLDRAGIANAAVNRVGHLWAHPQLRTAGVI